LGLIPLVLEVGLVVLEVDFEVLLDYGVSPIELDRATDNKENFECVIQSLCEEDDES